MSDSDGNSILCECFLFLCLLPICDVAVLEFFTGDRGKAWGYFAPGVADVLFEEGKRYLTLYLVFALSLVDIQDMGGYFIIILVGIHIPDNEDTIESG